MLKCEICGGTDLVKQNGLFVCQSCGMKYSAQELRKMVGSTSVTDNGERDASVENLIALAKDALENGKAEEAETYANEALERNAASGRVWRIKGSAVGWQTTLVFNRLPEAVSAFTKALLFASDEERKETEEEVSFDFYEIFLAILKLHLADFSEEASSATEENADKAVEILQEGIALLNRMCMETGLAFPRDLLHEKIAKAFEHAACEAFGKLRTLAAYQESYQFCSTDSLQKFINGTDECIRLSEIALSFGRNAKGARNSLIDHMILMYEATCKACSGEFSLTDEAVRSRKGKMDELEKLKGILEKGDSAE